MPSFATIGRSIRKLFSENPRGLHHSPLCQRGLTHKKTEYEPGGNETTELTRRDMNGTGMGRERECNGKQR